MSSNFKIATYAAGVGALAALDALSPAVPDPQMFYEPYSTRVRLGDGTWRGLGYPRAEWHFPLLTLAQRNVLAAYCTTASAQVYIASPKGTGTFANWLVIMRLPETEPPIKGGYMMDYVIKFERLVEQV